MILLAIETSTSFGVLALRTGDGAIRENRTDPATRHGRSLVPALRDLLASARVRPAELDAIAVGLGPGSFTGLRIGLTAAKTLAYATNRPLIGLDSLDVVARNAPPGSSRVALLVDAQRGELFAAEYALERHEGRPTRLGPTRIVSAAEYLSSLPAGTIVLGPALERPTLVVPPGLVCLEPSRNHPEGEALLAAAEEAYLDGRRDDGWFLEPTYIRRSAAEEKADARAEAPGRS